MLPPSQLLMGGVLHGAGGRKKERMFEEPIDSVGAGVSRFKRFRFTPFSIPRMPVKKNGGSKKKFHPIVLATCAWS